MGPESQRVRRPGVRQRQGDAVAPNRPFPHPVEPLVPKPIRVAAVLFMGDGGRPLPTALLISVVPGAVLLVAAVVSLLLPQGRAAFRTRAA